MSRYNFIETEQKWQKIWNDQKVFSVSEDKSKPKYYVLEMFPYPSGKLHMGHLRNYAIGDVTARFKKAMGYNILHPMGWDAFGLPAENAALQHNVHPADWTYKNIDAMRTQLKSIGLSIDWDREIATCHPEYYKHEQKMFLDFMKADIVERKFAWVNWDPVEHTVLANEQVVDGKGWRSGAQVERKQMATWSFKITDFADELLADLNKIDWPDAVKTMQSNWIGRSEGALVHWDILAQNNPSDINNISVYTTRPDTLFGASFIAIAAHHPLAQKLAQQNKELQDFIAECDALGTAEEAIETAEKRGFDTGLKAIHPFDNTKNIPIWVANFVLMEYGTGAVFGCPAHDQRDLDFARKYNLNVTTVVVPKDNPHMVVANEAYTEDGIHVNSDFMNGMGFQDAFDAALKHLENNHKGEKQVNFRLRDWGISRQRYWGCPVPIIHCKDCGVVAVPDEQLPVTLPQDVTFDKPGNPLEHHPTWKHTKCPNCGHDAQRETDTFDTFMESSWYFLRYCSPRLSDGVYDADDIAYWMAVDQYIGGVEHAVLHLLYARFFTKALKKIGYPSLPDEPFQNLLTQGMVNHMTYKDSDNNWVALDDVKKQGDGFVKISDASPVFAGRSEKMSKSKLNGVDPEIVLSAYGADAARLFILSDNPPERDIDWTEGGIEGSWKFLGRIYRFATENTDYFQKGEVQNLEGEGKSLWQLTHKTIAQVTEDLSQIRTNNAIARIRELFNGLEKYKQAGDDASILRLNVLKIVCQLLNPYAPHITEEIYSQLGYDDMLAHQNWPKADDAWLVQDSITLAVQVRGKMRGTIEVAADASKDDTEKAALALDNVQKELEGQEIKKIIVVPGRIVNIVY
ncbi:MAG: leucine--tRNA ligase [Alphaproteobacteria bacterium]